MLRLNPAHILALGMQSKPGGGFMSIRIRDSVSELPTQEYFRQRTAEGWIVAAVEWIKPSSDLPVQASGVEHQFEEVPYGQRIAPDCSHLVEDILEMDVLLFIYAKIVAACRPTQIAIELNKRGYRTRRDSTWTPGAVFNLLPRLIDLGPIIQRRPDWPARRTQFEVQSDLNAS